MAQPAVTDEVLLATVALEPNRWGTIRPDRSPEIRLAPWLDRIAALGVDGLEVWDGHVAGLDAAALAEVLAGPVPVRILSSYVDLDDPDPTRREAAADLARRLGARAVKFNVGNDPASESAYAERIAAWVDVLPADAALICECHARTTIAEDPEVAARVLTAAGPAGRVQALVHTHDGPERIAAAFDALGERITHVHVNHLDLDTLRHPALAEVEDRLAAAVTAIRSGGFVGSWSMEFVAGLLTSDDHPAALLDQAAADLPVLRRVLAAS